MCEKHRCDFSPVTVHWREREREREEEGGERNIKRKENQVGLGEGKRKCSRSTPLPRRPYTMLFLWAKNKTKLIFHTL